MKPLSILSLAALLPLAACATTRDQAAPAPVATPRPVPVAAEAAGHEAITTTELEPYECGSITRLHTFGGIFLASQPMQADFEQAKLGGVKTVINLRHASELEGFDERAFVEGLGLAYVELPWNGAAELTDQVFTRSRELLNTVERPILLHCSSANRVGAVWIPWRVLDGGVTWEQALAEARTIGIKTPEYETKAKDYVARHRPASP